MYAGSERPWWQLNSSNLHFQEWDDVFSNSDSVRQPGCISQGSRHSRGTESPASTLHQQHQNSEEKLSGE